MLRVLMLLVVMLLGACAGAKKPPALPETAPGGWHLRETKQEQAKTIGIYDGPGTVRVEVEDMGSQAVAFERAQRTRQQPDMVFFDKGTYFVTVRWERADRDALKLFVRELEKRL
jgi:outer membrane biogenesis lipoprotein LolB